MRRAELRVVNGPDSGRVVGLAATSVVGREQDADITLDDDQISRRHARFVVENGTVLVQNLGSTNGTLVNGTPIDQPHSLVAGDRVAIGDTELEFVPAQTWEDQLEVTQGSAAGTVIPVGDGIVVGRDPASDLTLDGDDEVSRRHLRVYLDVVRPMVEDLGSTNGTFVNGERITGPMPIETGDRIELGSAALTFSTMRPGVTRTRRIAPQISAVRDMVAQPSALLSAE